MLRFLCAMLLGLALLTPDASAQKGGTPPAASSSSLALQVCNESGRNVFVALVYRDSGGWHSAGWWQINNGQCDTPATADNLVFYAFAEEVGNSGRHWGGEFEHCITRPGPYDFLINPDYTECGKDQDLVSFIQLEANGFGTYTWTLDP